MNNKYKFDLDLEKYLLNDLDSPSKQRIKDEIVINKELRDELERLNKNNDDFFNRFPVNKFISEIKERSFLKENKGKIDFIGSISSSVKRISGNYKKILIPSFSMAAALLIIILFSNKFNGTNVSQNIYNNYSQSDSNIQTDKEIRLKGPDSFLQIYRKGLKRNEKLNNYSHVKERDIIQICYFSARKYGLIFSIDSNGEINIHFPDKQNEAALLKRNKVTPLSFSYRLDNAPFERFFLVTSDQKFNIDIVLKTAKAISENSRDMKEKDLELPEEFNQSSILLLQ